MINLFITTVQCQIIPLAEVSGVFYNLDTKEVISRPEYIEPMPLRMQDKYKDINITEQPKITNFEQITEEDNI